MQAQTEFYSRGSYRLTEDRRRDGTLRSPNFQIVWYDRQARRNRYRSTGTASVHEAEDALDRLYSERERGITICPCCQRPLEHVNKYTVEQGIVDYLAAKSEECSSIGEMRSRLNHFLDFLEAKEMTGLDCNNISKRVIGQFRRWSRKEPVVIGKPENGRTRKRAPSTTEASVRQLKAVVNFAFAEEHILSPARFSPLPPEAVDSTPTFRASIEQLAEMFRYCIEPETPKHWERQWTAKERAAAIESRVPLLRFLQFSVATWCRPDAAHDFSILEEREQWVPEARVLKLNPRGRIQTKKRRPTIPAARQLVPLLNDSEGHFVPVGSVRKAFETMTKEIGIFRDRQTGMKLIRRSISQLVRDRIGEHRWPQGQMMLGHTKTTTSDLYALKKPSHLGLALRHTEAIIDEIESAIPGAFTGVAPERKPGKEH